MFIANIVVIIGSVVQAAAFKTRDMIVGRQVISLNTTTVLQVLTLLIESSLVLVRSC